MVVFRWFVGFIKALVRIWDQDEWFYYALTGFDPRLPAFERWDMLSKVVDKQPETEAERIMPVKNHWVILHDKYSQTPDEVIFFTTDKDKVDALMDEYKRELRTRTAGNFFYKMIRGRNLDFLHKYIPPGQEQLIEGTEIDKEQEREKFLR